MVQSQLPALGFGLGLRSDHYAAIVSDKPPVDFFEIITENYMISGGKALCYLDQIRANYPMVMHGVSLSLGSTDPLDMDYLKQLKSLSARVEPAWISDHLCWTGIRGINTHDLLPLPYTEQAISHIAQRIEHVQAYLGQQILIENVSSYVDFHDSEMTEWEFLTAIAAKADCLILLDVNNIYVSGMNHGFNPSDYLQALPAHRIQQIHLAGHRQYDNFIIDTHDAPIISAVWDLYRQAISLFGQVSTLIERDDAIPPLHELLCELNHAREVAQALLEEPVT